MNVNSLTQVNDKYGQAIKGLYRDAKGALVSNNRDVYKQIKTTESIHERMDHLELMINTLIERVSILTQHTE